MSLDEEQRRQERAAQDDAMAAGRLARMRARLGRDGPGLIPVVIPTGGITRPGPPVEPHLIPEIEASKVEVRAYLLEWAEKGPFLVILDEDVVFASDAHGTLPRGSFFRVPYGHLRFSPRVPAWFLDGGSPS